MRVTGAWIGIAMACAASGTGVAEEIIPTSGIERLTRLMSPEFRSIEQRLAEIEEELKDLPVTREATFGSRYGHRSGDLPTETTPDWVQLDFGETRRVDMVALVPVWMSFRGPSGAGHGFPRRFRIELADNPQMKDAVVLVDRSGHDVVNPGRNPMVIEVEPSEGRYLRFTSLRHVREDGVYFWALEELMALEGNCNVARSADLTLSSSQDLFPLWVPVRLVDGQHALGMPVNVTRPSPSTGYLSESRPYIGLTEGMLPAGEEKWCAVDLGSIHPIDQVRVLPLESDEYAVYGGRGFPRHFVVQLAMDPDFREIVWEQDQGRYPLGYPAGCSLAIEVPGVRARHVRVITNYLWSRDGEQVFGLAELQVYADGQNVALGKPVRVTDQADLPPESGWAPAYLTDGYTSRYQLAEWPGYLRQLSRRGDLLREQAILLENRRAKVLLGRRLVIGSGVTLLILLVAGWIWVLWWQGRERRRAILLLRQQISRDLHDDIGSNLGGIALLSEIGRAHSHDDDSRQDFRTIHEAAEEASSSMRDIVWLVQRDEVGIRDMVMRMREAAAMILHQVELDFTVEPAQFRDCKLSLFFRRHLFFAFKEALNNIRKHAQASRVEVRIEIHSKRLRFEVRDDGSGFDPAAVQHAGSGLLNLSRRASRISGSCRVDSRPGEGTYVVFEAPFKTKVKP